MNDANNSQSNLIELASHLTVARINQVFAEAFSSILKKDSTSIELTFKYLLGISSDLDLSIEAVNIDNQITFIDFLLSECALSFTGEEPIFTLNVSCNESNARAYLIQEIQARTDSTFDGIFDSQEITPARLIEIWDAISDCPIIDATDLININSLLCIIDKIQPDPNPIIEIEDALKQRIIKAVQVIQPSYNPSQHQDIQNDIDSKTVAQLFDNIPFKYNRVGVANHAINESRTNFASFPRGDGKQTSSVIGSIGGQFKYSSDILIHEPGKTGSSIFLSECIYFGGQFPMVKRTYNNDDCSQEASQLPSGVDYSVVGWRVCCYSVDNDLIATTTWKDHQGVIGFWSNSSLPIAPHGIISGNRDDNNSNLLRTHINFDQNGIFKLSTSQQEVNTLLYPRFSSTGDLGTIDTGDYILIEQGNGSHGFLIVGWGPIVECREGLNAQTESNEINTTISISKQNNGQEIPYIADFGYGYRFSDTNDPEHNKTGWIQDPRPRPFYASAARIPSLDKSDESTPPDTQNNIDFYEYSLEDYQERQRSIYQAFTTNDNETRPSWQFYKLKSFVAFQFIELYRHSGC